MTDQKPARKNLSLTLRVGETVSLDGGRIRITVQEQRGKRVGLRFAGDVSVDRERPAHQAAAQARQGIAGLMREVPSARG